MDVEKIVAIASVISAGSAFIGVVFQIIMKISANNAKKW